MKNSCKSVALKGFARIAALRRTALSIGVLLALGVSTAALLKAQAAARLRQLIRTAIRSS